MTPIVDPRHGDVEDDASSTKRRSLLSLAGSLLVEVSLPKLLAAWFLLAVVPAVVLGVFPLIASAWIAKVGGQLGDTLLDVASLATLLAAP